MDRAFSSFTVRTISEDQRIIEGIATTPRVDRSYDIVESSGAEFDLPIPFLLDHDHTQAVGEVEAAEVTPTGIRFRARIKKIAEAGAAKDLTDKAWSLVKNGLRKFVSIGFAPLDYEQIAGGLRFTRWEWLELSAVAIPANPDAAIQGVRSAGHRRGADRVVSLRRPGAASSGAIFTNVGLSVIRSLGISSPDVALYQMARGSAPQQLLMGEGYLLTGHGRQLLRAWGRQILASESRQLDKVIARQKAGLPVSHRRVKL